jgi:hypothetical protein
VSLAKPVPTGGGTDRQNEWKHEAVFHGWCSGVRDPDSAAVDVSGDALDFLGRLNLHQL